MLHLRLLEKQQQAKLKREEIIKIRVKNQWNKTNKTKQKTKKPKPYKETMKQMLVLWKKIKKIDKPLANLTKMKREISKLIKSETKRGW
jgi:hypothetical protein